MTNNSQWTTEIKQSGKAELKKMLAEAEEKQKQTVDAFVNENIELITQLISSGFTIKKISERLADIDKSASKKSAIEAAIKKALPVKKPRRKTKSSPVPTGDDSGKDGDDKKEDQASENGSESVTEVGENQSQESNNNGLESASFLED